MSVKTSKKVFATVSTLALSCTLAVGCGSSKQADQSTSKGPVVITMMAPFFNAQPPQTDGSPVLQQMEQLTNSKLNITWAPDSGNVYLDKVNVAISSGSLPEVFVSEQPKNSEIVSAAQSGMFWEIGPYLKDYPNIQKWLNPLAEKNSEVNGKIYGLYLARPISRIGVLVRQDLLDKNGLKPPQTPQEVYNVAKALTKNGIYGIGMQFNLRFNDEFWNGIATMTTGFGGPNQWGMINGKATPDFMTPQGMQALKLYRQMYNEKILDPDFSSPGFDVNNAFSQGKVAMMVQTYDAAIRRDEPLLQQVDPNAKVSIVASMQGPNGPINPATPGSNGEILFSKTSIKTVQQLKDILGYFDRTLDQSVSNLLSYGVEGTSYKTVNGVPQITDQQYINNNVTPFTELTLRSPIVDLPGETDTQKYANQILKDNEKYAVPNIADSLISQTYVNQGPQLDKIMMDADIKYISGSIDDAGFQNAINSWLKAGGQKVIDEYTQAYNQSNSK